MRLNSEKYIIRDIYTMLIESDVVAKLLRDNNITVNGVLHIGAHECEELSFYNNFLNIPSANVIWVDAIPEKVALAKVRGIPNVYQAIMSDKEGEKVKFNLSNNGQSSSILEFGTHATEHPQVTYIDSFEGKTTTIDTFLKTNGLNSINYNFWNLDIQGAEYMALCGGIDSLKNAKVLYLEVNAAELYKGCALLPQLDDFLSTQGFKRVLMAMTVHKWGDAIYIRN